MTRLLAPKPGLKHPLPLLKQHVVIPIISNSSNKPYPTNIFTNSSTTAPPTLTQTPLLYSTLAESENIKSPSQITAATNVIVVVVLSVFECAPLPDSQMKARDCQFQVL
jgi:hypothetical protein